MSFDVWFSETSLYENDRVVPTIEKLKAAGYTYEEEGALGSNQLNLVMIKTGS